MNRYPWWKYLILAVAMVVGLLYTLPNFFGEAPAVQVSSGKATLKVDAGLVPRVEQALQAAGLKPDFVQLEGNSVRARFGDTDTQLKARDAIVRALNPDPADPRTGSIRRCRKSRAWRAGCGDTSAARPRAQIPARASAWPSRPSTAPCRRRR